MALPRWNGESIGSPAGTAGLRRSRTCTRTSRTNCRDDQKRHSESGGGVPKAGRARARRCNVLDVLSGKKAQYRTYLETKIISS